MPKVHHKKRNSGLLMEFLAQSISRALIAGDSKRANHALKLIKRHFKVGTQLHKEYRLINSLLRTTVSNPSVAASIMQEAKRAARSHDVRELDREKSLLISNINKVMGDNDFFDQPVKEYRTLATIQTLINDWRSDDCDLGRMAQYEDQLTSWLVLEKVAESEIVLPEESPGESRLLMKVMMRKLNEKYSGIMSDEQRGLIRAFAFSTANSDPSSIRLKLAEIKDRLLKEICSYKGTPDMSESLVNKLDDVAARLNTETLEKVDDETVTRFMLYTQLSSTIGSEE
jgi:hypothetical protein